MRGTWEAGDASGSGVRQIYVLDLDRYYEHVIHGFRIHDPMGNILVELYGAPEHVCHIHRIMHVPMTDILVEFDSVVEHSTHVNYTTYCNAPMANISVEG